MALITAISLCVVCLMCVALAAAGLPGIWLMALTAIGVKWWQPELVDWWVIAATVGIALLGELLEFIAGAAGARKAGGSTRAAIGAVVGGVVGAIVGTVLIPIPLVGTILGSALGSGAGAVGLELTLQSPEGAAPKAQGHHRRVGVAAFTGRLIATAIKAAMAVVAWVMVSAAAFYAALGP